jgi:hypothetical protein
VSLAACAQLGVETASNNEKPKKTASHFVAPPLCGNLVVDWRLILTITIVRY